MWQLPNVELPWAASMSKETNGKVTGEILPYNQVGLKGFEMLRMLQVGAIEFSRGDISTHGGDNPRFESLDFPGLTPTIDDVRKAAGSYRPILDAIMKKSGIKLLFLAPNTPQVIWCKPAIKGVADLKGLKVRVYNKGLATFISGVGGTPITMSSSEVVTSVQRGVIDCAITGTTNGNTGKWPEVTTHLLPLYMGWGTQYWAVNLKTWNRLDPKVRTYLEKKFVELKDALWKAALDGAQPAIDCSVGRACNFPGLNKYNMTLVKITDADIKLARKVIKEHVLTAWGQRCGLDCVKEWNGTVGKVLNIKAPLP
jgi:TRAP-type C4-dicarboxylate transport system substrate-binding protein